MTAPPTIDRAASARRIEHDIETLAGAGYTQSATAICRYAYTDVYRNTVAYFRERLEELGFTVAEDPVGNLVARNLPAGEAAFGLGSHCDSNRNGGRYDGTLGVVTALEVCRLDREHGLGLPLQLISFLEEEGSGFGQMLLGSRIVAQRVTEEDLRQHVRAIDDGAPFWRHAEAAGFAPSRWRECAHILDGLTAWIETHIEQARVLQDTATPIGVVDAIAGYVHADITVTGRADHAGATPMDMRQDAALVAAECVVELERLATAAGRGTVGTVGEIELDPGLINVVPGRARFSLDVRGVDDGLVRGVVDDIAAFAAARAERRGMTAEAARRQELPATPLAEHVADALERAAAATGTRYRRMHSGAAHDTMCVAPRVPSAMVFVPCLDGISHSPAERADPRDAALAAEIITRALLQLKEGG